MDSQGPMLQKRKMTSQMVFFLPTAKSNSFSLWKNYVAIHKIKCLCCGTTPTIVCQSEMIDLASLLLDLAVSWNFWSMPKRRFLGRSQDGFRARWLVSSSRSDDSFLTYASDSLICCMIHLTQTALCTARENSRFTHWISLLLHAFSLVTDVRRCLWVARTDCFAPDWTDLLPVMDMVLFSWMNTPYCNAKPVGFDDRKCRFSRTLMY